MRLAVILAIHPLARRRRALAIVHAAREDQHADGLNGLHLGRHERQHDVEIVNHQVEYDVDVQTALGERAKAMDFDKAWVDQQGPRSGFRPKVELAPCTCC